MAMQRWDPFHEMRNFREAMERLVHEGIIRPASG
nr:Hsp20/alpha crystallin family protein [Ktedonobacterales bacterium]